MLTLKINLNSLKKKLLCLKYMPIKTFRDYRDGNYNYKPNDLDYNVVRSRYQPQFDLTEEERIENDKLPVEERILDWRKYMKHKGKLKYTSGVFLVDVEPFPRLKIMMLCDIAMNTLKKMPDSLEYKHYIYNYIKYIMRVVDENESIVDIESKLSDIKSAEDLIMSLHNEVTLLYKILNEKWWEIYEEEKKNSDLKEFLFQSVAFKDFLSKGNKFGESEPHRKNERPQRPSTANYSEQTKESPKH